MKLLTLETDLHWFPDHFLTFSGLFSSFLFKMAKICRMALDVGFSHHFVKKLLFYYHILMQSIQKRVYTSPTMNKNGWKNNGFFIRGLNHTKLKFSQNLTKNSLLYVKHLVIRKVREWGKGFWPHCEMLSKQDFEIKTEVFWWSTL